MAGPGIPQRVNATKAVTARQEYRGALAAAQLPRLKESAVTGGELQCELRADREKSGAWLRGGIRGTLTLTCQRGLHPFTWDCAVRVELRLVQSESEEGRVLRDTEPYLVQDDTLPLRELVEDEVLLALPMMPRCSDLECALRLRDPEAGRRPAS
ncbi:MAG TPA: DUF177 domain-containing protein [Candidatus Binatia bacterium]|nr:DUF177 domain-containing protein [Candidatus Binatia bacterium]